MPAAHHDFVLKKINSRSVYVCLESLASGVESDLSKPHTAIQLLFGAAPDSTTSAAEATSPVNEAQAIQAWDAVLNSFHYRGPRPGESEATR